MDLAGTVVDHGSRAPAGAFIELLRRHDVIITDAQARGPMGMEKRNHIAVLLELPEARDQWTRAHGAAPTEEDIDALYAEFIPLQVECLPKYGDLIPGTVKTISTLRERGIRVAANTGYNRQMMEIVLREAAKGGFEPDAAVCASDVAAGRPAPWMALRCMEEIGAYPAASVVHVGDTLVDIEAGLNAGAWSIGVVESGNMLARSAEELEALDPEERIRRTESARQEMLRAGAHFAIDSVVELPPTIDALEARLRRGEQP